MADMQYHAHAFMGLCNWLWKVLTNVRAVKLAVNGDL